MLSSVTLKNLDRLDDGSFQRMVAEIEGSVGKERRELVIDLITERVIHNLVTKVREKSVLTTGQDNPSPCPRTGFRFFENLPTKKRGMRGRNSVAVAVSIPVLDRESDIKRKNLEQLDRKKKEKEKEPKVLGRKRHSESGNGDGKRAKPRKNPKPERWEIPTEMPSQFKSRVEEMGGRDIVFVMQKKLFASDMIKTQNRLLIPAGEVKNKFLLPAEEKKLASKVEQMKVTLIEPSVEATCILHLRKWHMNNDPYALVGKWFSVTQRNKDTLQIGSIIQLWSFRHPDSSLGMVLVPVPQVTTPSSVVPPSSSSSHSTLTHS